MRIKQIMTTNLEKAAEETPLTELQELFNNNAFHHLPVVDNDNKLLGILSDRDVSNHLSPFIGTPKEREQDRELLKLSARDIMSAEPITVAEDSMVDTASILLLEYNFSCLPIVDNENHLVGLVTWKDILNYYVYSAS